MVYAVSSPAKAMISPAAAGPATPPICQRSAFRAAAADSCSCGTMRGMIASSAGRWMPVSALEMPPAAYSGHVQGCGSS